MMATHQCVEARSLGLIRKGVALHSVVSVLVLFWDDGLFQWTKAGQRGFVLLKRFW